MFSFLKTLWNVIIKSSEDPQKYSLAIKGYLGIFLTLYTAHVIPAVTATCVAGYLCQFADPSFTNELTNGIELAGDIVFYALMCVSIVGAFFGSVRKIWTLINGTNPHLSMLE